MVIVSAGTAKENAAFLPSLAPERVLLQVEHDVADAYAAYGTPAAVIVDVRGNVASEVAAGRDAIAKIVGRAATVWDDGKFAPSTPSAPAIDTAAPEFSAATTDGATLASSDLRGNDTTLVFWSPTCGFCRQAAADLVAWEAQSETRFVVLSSAPDDDLVARGLKHPIAIDEGMRVGHLFGAGGTPMAIRIAADGAIASKLPAGRDAIGQLVRPETETVT
jgi:AhpC/TSA family